MNDQPGLGEWSVPVIGFLGLLVWLAVLGRERAHLSDHQPFPRGVRDASLVGLLAATFLGSISALGFADVLSDYAIIFGALWRSSVLACGVYALIASIRDDDQQARQRQPTQETNPPPDR